MTKSAMWTEQQVEAATEGLDDRLDRLLVTSTHGERFVLSGVSAHNITEIVKEWLRTRAASPVMDEDRDKDTS